VQLGVRECVYNIKYTLYTLYIYHINYLGKRVDRRGAVEERAARPAAAPSQRMCIYYNVYLIHTK